MHPSIVDRRHSRKNALTGKLHLIISKSHRLMNVIGHSTSSGRNTITKITDGSSMNKSRRWSGVKMKTGMHDSQHNVSSSLQENLNATTLSKVNCFATKDFETLMNTRLANTTRSEHPRLTWLASVGRHRNLITAVKETQTGNSVLIHNTLSMKPSNLHVSSSGSSSITQPSASPNNSNTTLVKRPCPISSIKATTRAVRNNLLSKGHR